MKALKAFIEASEAPKRSVKKKLIFISIQLSETHRVGRVNHVQYLREKTQRWQNLKTRMFYFINLMQKNNVLNLFKPVTTIKLPIFQWIMFE